MSFIEHSLPPRDRDDAPDLPLFPPRDPLEGLTDYPEKLAIITGELMRIVQAFDAAPASETPLLSFKLAANRLHAVMQGYSRTEMDLFIHAVRNRRP